MEKRTISEDLASTSRRIYLELPVLTPEPIISLQQDLIGIGDFDPIPVSKLHLTLFHLGKPNELYWELLLQNPKLTADKFARELSEVFRHSLYDQGEYVVFGKALSLFEKRTKPIIVLNLDAQKELLELRSEVLAGFEAFAKACGVSDISGFMDRSSNLRYQSLANFEPHISIGYIPEKNDLPMLDVSRIGLVLGSPKIANE